ncbi:MAG: hypothetical protein QF733_09015 [Phycisphaerales bacterium]|nr:hypothetical protein [Phycisphaerales bacterium]
MRRGFSIVGLLVVVAVLLVMYAMFYGSISGLKSGTDDAGRAVPASPGRLTDMFQTQQLMQSLISSSIGGDPAFPRPSDLTGDEGDDVTAAVYSLLIAQRIVSPDALISDMDWGNVEPYDQYDWHAWNPAEGEYWDAGFSADLDEYSNVSYAHLVLYGDRATHWSSRRMDSTMPVLGNRGPEGGVPSVDSLTCDPDTGRWAGYFAYGDGHVSLVQGLDAARRAGAGGEDHVFRIDDDDAHGDAILGFTRSIGRSGPMLQWD